MRPNIVIVFALLILLSCKSSNTQVTKETLKTSSGIIGGGCDGCEIMYVDMPASFNHVDTSASWMEEKGQKLVINGTTVKNDGKTPAADVVVYYWHTNELGLYTSAQKSNATNHGDLRGWVKTDSLGNFQIFTTRPAPYPNDSLPAHIHLAIKEPELSVEYYSDDIVFDDDPLLQPYLKLYPPTNRCGSGVVKIEMQHNIQTIKHHLTLGLNIPNYPSIEKKN